LVVIDGEEDGVTGMVVDKDDNLILADQSLLRMYSKDEPLLVKKSSCCKYFSIKETDFFNSESSLSI
jgi:hypothetical protein